MAAILDWNVYLQTAADAVAEGVVMLKNDHNALPLPKNEAVAVFGRIQLHYYKSGTGSGGMVNAPVVTGILEGLAEQGIAVDETLLQIYKEWDQAHPYDLGEGWGAEPWSQPEMPLTDEIAAESAKTHSRAIVVIGRTAGEEQDHRTEAGSYLLTQEELTMLQTVRRHFQRMIVLLNVGGIIDMHAIESTAPDAVLYIWQGGMTGGSGTAAVLSGEVSPSGKLPDTIAMDIADYPSHPYFGDKNRNFQTEDIYIGYRYFETFAKDRVRYPFGFGLSYTQFTVSLAAVTEEDDTITLTAAVKNIGAYSGKEVVQLYVEAPQGALGKPTRALCGFAKTRTLAPDEQDLLTLHIRLRDLASYDDSGATGNPYCYVLEAGAYQFYLGTDVRSAEKCYTYLQAETEVTSRCVQCMAPVLPFERMRPEADDEGYHIVMEPVPLSKVDEVERYRMALPSEIPHTGDMGITLQDVKNGTATLRAFIAQLSREELSSLVRGEGMGSPRVTAGTASAFGGVSKALEHYGIPAVCCSDGPSGMRLDCGTPAFSLPNGTLLAATFNTELLRQLFTLMGLEMRANRVDCLLGPGMNLHRHPLNGRNFEYFSEDPYLTGMMATAQLEGLHSVGVTGTLKHFCGNEQETNRHFLDAVISERALREVYLKGFEIAVKQGKAKSIMTTYGSVNGLWTAGNPDLTTLILREEWGFSGIAMTDWWANINRRGEEPRRDLFSVMVAAQNDLYMVCADTETPDADIMQALENGTLTLGELQRCAANICGFILRTPAMQRLCGTAEEVQILNRPTEGQPQEGAVQFFALDTDTLTIPLEEISTERGTAFSFALDVKTMGYYHITLTASSDAGTLAQMPVTLFSMGTAQNTFTWNGTEGKPVSFSTNIPMFSRFTTMRLYFAQSGLKMHSISFARTVENVNIAAL